MSRALDNVPHIQELVKEWKEEDIDVVLSKIGEIVDNPNSTRIEKMLAQFASLGAIYVQARRIERGL
jgi:hypothetical protein